MTFIEAYDILDDMCDKAGTAYFTPTEKKRALKQSLYEWLEAISSEFERDNVLIDGIYPLVEGPAIITYNSTTRIGTIPADFLYRLECYRNTPENEIKYVKFNNWSAVHNDPHSTPNAEFPVYRIKSNGFQFSGLLSNDVPNLSYIKKPTFAADDNVGDWVNLPEPELYKVIKYCYKFLANSMTDDRYQMAVELLRNKNV